jgi:hypothetical protein
MIENARNNDPRNQAKYGMNMDYASMAMNRQAYDGIPEDEPLENYLAVEDADMVTVDRSFGIGNDYQYGKFKLIYSINLILLISIDI